MQDYEDKALREECDYALCHHCHSLIKPYHNTSIMTITEKIGSSRSHSDVDSVQISKRTLASTHPFTRSLLKHHHLHCAKCGLYLEIHPQLDDDHSQKIFVCSHATPHPYGLCYHCGLLYGINPMQKSIDIITILHSQIDSIEQDEKAKASLPAKSASMESKLLKIASTETGAELESQGFAHKQGKEDEEERQEKEEEEEEEHSLESKEVNDISDAVESSDGDDSCSARPALHESATAKSHGPGIADGNESYGNLLALRKTNKTASCPTSPTANNSSSSKGVQAHSSIFGTLPHSLRGSPLLGASTPSPRVLSRDVDETDKKWHDYLHRKEEKKATIHARRSNSKSKLEETQSQIEQLQLLLKQASSNKSSSKEFADIFRRGAYSSKVTMKLTNTEK